MDEKKLREQVHYAVDTHSPSYSPDPYMAQRVLHASESGGRVIVKNKFSVVFVLMLVFMFMSLTALAVALLTGTQIIEQVAVPMAQENDTETFTRESYTHEELVQLIQTLNENGITLDEDASIMKALHNGQGYWEEEVLMAICREAFGGSFSTWSIEEKHWFDNMTVQIGFKEKNPYLIPGEGDMTIPEAKAYAVKLLKDEYGVELPVESNEKWMIWEWFYAPWTDTTGFHPAMWKFEFVNRNSMYVEYTVRFSWDGGDVQLDRAYFHEETIEATNYDQVDRYMSDKYGAMPYWPVSAWAEFGELLESITPVSKNQWCWKNAGYCEPPEDALTTQEAIDIAQADIAMEGTINSFVICCSVDDRTFYKVTLSIYAPGNEGNPEYDAVWCVEMDCRTGEITGKQEYRYGESILPMYVPFSVIEKSPTYVQQSTVADSVSIAEKERQADAYDAYTRQYGDNWYFWPLEAQKDALGRHHHVPEDDEMTREEAVEMALQAIETKHGKDALTQLGDYQVGVICCLYEETEGPRYSWELYITSDPEFMSNGFRVNIIVFEGVLEQPEVEVVRANSGNG